jgi:hypothetical protein
MYGAVTLSRYLSVLILQHAKLVGVRAVVVAFTICTVMIFVRPFELPCNGDLTATSRLQGSLPCASSASAQNAGYAMIHTWLSGSIFCGHVLQYLQLDYG